MSAELLEKAIVLAHAGRQQEACELLAQVIAADVHNEPAWLLYANALPDEADRAKALKECLLHNPNSKEAQEELAALKRGAPPKPQTDDRPGIPTVPGSMRAKATGTLRRRLAYALGGVVLLIGAAALLTLGWWIGQGGPSGSLNLAVPPEPTAMGIAPCSDDIIGRFQSWDHAELSQGAMVFLLFPMGAAITNERWGYIGRGTDGCVAIMTVDVNGIPSEAFRWYIDLSTEMIHPDNDAAAVLVRQRRGFGETFRLP